MPYASNVYAINEVSRYKSLGYERLHGELIALFNQAEAAMSQFNEDKKTKLLPALLAMKALTEQPGQRVHDPDRINWTEECARLGTTPEQVRQWKHRTQSEADIRQALGEQPPRPKKKKPDEDSLIEALKDARRMAKLALNAKTEAQRHELEKFSAAYLEKYGGVIS